MVECKGLCPASGVLNSDDASAIVSGMLDHIQPERLGMLTSAVELGMRQAYRTVAELSRHGLHLHPAHRLTHPICFQQVESRVLGWGPPQSRLPSQNPADRLLLEVHPCLLVQTVGIGLLISTACRTQQQALMTVFLVFFPFVLLSGFMFPIENMPRSVQYLTWVNPLRYFLVILRGIFLKGTGVEILWPQMAALLGMGSALLAAATLRFRKTSA
jgi:hypothetical protein